MKPLHIVLILIALFLVIYSGISIYIANVLTSPPNNKTTFDRDQIGIGENVTFKSADNLQLKGWFFKGIGKKVIFFVPGFGENRANLSYGAPEIAKYFLSKGYSVLLFDLRGNGESEFTRPSFGQYEKNDVAGAYQYLKSQGYEDKNIGIVSDSLGAISTIMAARSINTVGAIVLDSPATQIKTIVEDIMYREKHVPKFLHPGIFLYAKLLFHIDVASVRPIDQMSYLKNTPLLFLHGADDTLIIPQNTLDLASKANDATRVVFPGAKHTESFKTNPELYKQLIGDFFEKNLSH